MPAETVREKALLEKPRLTREQIAERAARELPDGAYVNLGWGIPNLIANYLPREITVTSTAKMESWEWDAARSRARKIMTSWTP